MVSYFSSMQATRCLLSKKLAICSPVKIHNVPLYYCLAMAEFSDGIIDSAGAGINLKNVIKYSNSPQVKDWAGEEHSRLINAL